MMWDGMCDVVCVDVLLLMVCWEWSIGEGCWVMFCDIEICGEVLLGIIFGVGL